MRLTTLLVALSTSLLAAAQGRPAAPAGCTTKSFTAPSWLVENLQYTNSNLSTYNASGKASFHIFNRATNATADLTCALRGNGWNACSVPGKRWSNDTLQAAVQITGSSAQILVNQTWTCNDRTTGPKLAPFTATGNATVSLQGGKATTSPLLIRGSLVSPLAITPVYAWGPTGHASPSCASPDKFKFTLSVPFYTNLTGDGTANVPEQQFSVLVTNQATGYAASCMSGAGFGDGLTPTPVTGPLNLVCAGTEFQSSGGGRYSIGTTASFDPASFQFEVNQTWFCDADEAKPIQVSASSTSTLALDCTTFSIAGTTDTRVQCINSGDLTLSATDITTTPLPAYSVQDPVPGPDDCTLSSLFRPQWTFSAFEVDSSANISSDVAFNIILRTGSPGFQYPMPVYQGAAKEGGWYECVIGPNADTGEVLWPSRCSFRYDTATKGLELNAEWACEELDPAHPVLFSGVTTTKVNAPLACETVNGVSRCLTEDGAYQWTADITNVTWKQ